MLRYFNHLDYPKDGVIYFAHMQASVFNNIIKLKNNPDKYLRNVNIKKKKSPRSLLKLFFIAIGNHTMSRFIS